MNGYRHIARVTSEVHDSLIRWTRHILLEAGLDTVEVYGQFPPSGTVGTHLVMFLYQVSPDPKLVETSKGANLLGGRDRSRDRVSLVPRAWLAVGRSIRDALAVVFPVAYLPIGKRPPDLRNRPFPSIDELPAPLRDWYLKHHDPENGEVWLSAGDGERFAVPPSLWWYPGITLSTRYVAVAGEPGRGTTDRTSASAPMSLSALSVLATGIQLERELSVPLPPLPFAEELASYSLAMADALDLMEGTPEQDLAEIAQQLRAAIDGIQADSLATFGITPVHDLSNHEFALLMQALQRPLQAALNLMLRLRLGASAVFSPSVSIDITMPDPSKSKKIEE